MQTLWQDLRFGARMLLKQPGFTLIAVLTTGLLLREVPYHEPDRVVVL